MESKTFEQLFPDFDEKPLPRKNIALMRNKFYHGKMSRGRKLKPLPSRKVEVKSWNSLIYKAFSEFVH